MRGVFVARHFEKELLPQHQRIIRRIVNEVMAFGKAEIDEEKAVREEAGNLNPTEAYHASVLGRHPHQAFLIDGPKGAGKTTLLLNLRCALEQIGPRVAERHVPGTFPITELDRKGSGESLASFDRLRVGGAPRFLVRALPPLRPDSMETHESIMECVFAEMTHELDKAGGDIPQNAGFSGGHPNSHHGGEERRARARELKRHLHTEVAKGWYFARRLGVEALLNDSMNFDEYIERRSKEAVVSHRRVARWMRFVNDYLDLFESQMLAIFIDDTDISADLAADILHTIRMFFCHPRIVVLMAGNLHTLRQRLLTRALVQQSEAHKSLRSPESFTARFWREFERENLEEYFSKVLPRPYRHFISPSAPDAETALLSQTFVEFCGEQMRLRLPQYLQERRTTLRRGKSETRVRWSRYEALIALAQEPNSYHIEAENHIALWLLRNHYAAYLSPQTARHINQFRAMIDRDAAAPQAAPLSDKDSRGGGRAARRVMVALFTHPGNHGVLQRQSDFDGDAAAWLNRQKVSTNWRGARWLKLNELTLPHGTPSYELLLFRLDLILARPFSAWLAPGFTTSLLPEPSGRKIWAPEVWQEPTRTRPESFLGIHSGQRQIFAVQNKRLRLRQDLLGLSRVFSSPIIPANCLYFKDLRPFPDLAWIWDDEDKSEYRRFFDQFPVRNIDNMFRIDRFDPRGDYFRDVVLVFASYPLVQPIPSEEFVTDSRPLHVWELTDFEEIDKPELNARQGTSRQSPADYPKIEKDKLAFKRIKKVSHALADLYRKALSSEDKPVKRATMEMIRAVSPKMVGLKLAAADRTGLTPAQHVVSLIAPRYHRILNDVRRAYHAMRILEADINSYAFIAKVPPSQMEKTTDGSTTHVRHPWPQPFEHNRNDTYTIVDVDKFRATIGLNDRNWHRSGHEGWVPSDQRLVGRDPVADTRYWIPLTQPPANALESNPPWRLLQPFSTMVRECLLEGESPQKERFYKATIGVGDFGRERWQTEDSEIGKPDKVLDALRNTLEHDPGKKIRFRLRYARTAIDTDPFGPCSWTLEERNGATFKQWQPSSTDEKPSPESKDLLALLWPLCELGGSHRQSDARRRPSPRLFNTRDDSHAQESRMYRSILLMLWGISPCLSALIHLDTIGKYYSEYAGQDPQGTWDKQPLILVARDLDDWEVTIVTAIVCVIALATTLEINLDADLHNLDEYLKVGAKSGKTDPKYPKFCAMPDISAAILGLRLHLGDYPSDGVSKSDPARGKNDERPSNQGFGGIIGDVLLRLQLALYYVHELRTVFKDVWQELSAPANAPADGGGSTS